LTRRNFRDLVDQALAYCRSRPVWGACLIYQVAFYTYPPYALLVVVFPVVTVLFSRAPAAYRELIAVRDVIFIAGNVVIYSLSTMLIYLPIVRLFTAKGSGVAGAYESEFVENLYSGHQYAYNTSMWAVLRRLGNLLTVSGDLWLLPQTQMHIVTAVVLALGLAAARWGRTAADFRPLAPNGHSGAVAAGVLVVCFVMAASPVLASAGGFLGYRTSVGTTAVVAIIFIFAMRSLAEWLWSMIGMPSASTFRAGNGAVALVALMAFAANAYANYSLMKLGTNEYAYFSGIVRQAIADKARGIVLIDPRPWRGAQDYNHWPIADQQGRAVPPFELGCFSSYCRLTGGIVRVIANDLGVSDKSFDLLVTRGDDPVPGLTCEMLKPSASGYPANASKQAIAIIERYRALTPLSCHQITMDWHDLGIDLKR
jgi:hypothetical protein